MSNTAIPKGTSKQDIEARRRIIKAQLSKLKGKTVKCPCLGNVPVCIESKSILQSVTKDGTSAKLTIGVREFPLKFLQYCVTVSG